MAHDQCESLKIKVNKPPLLHREGSERYGEECKGWERELSGRGSRKLSFRQHFQRSKLIHGQFCPLPFGSFCHFCEGMPLLPPTQTCSVVSLLSKLCAVMYIFTFPDYSAIVTLIVIVTFISSIHCAVYVIYMFYV